MDRKPTALESRPTEDEAADDVGRFRELCLLSADAVIRGRNSIQGDMNPWWTRDQGIAWPDVPRDPEARQRNLRQKDEAMTLWGRIVELAESIRWPDPATRDYAVASARYGHRLYRIYRAVVYLADAEARQDGETLADFLAEYDAAWADYQRLTDECPAAASLYTKDYQRHTPTCADAVIAGLRQAVSR